MAKPIEQQYAEEIKNLFFPACTCHQVFRDRGEIDVTACRHHAPPGGLMSAIVDVLLRMMREPKAENLQYTLNISQQCYERHGLAIIDVVAGRIADSHVMNTIKRLGPDQRLEIRCVLMKCQPPQPNAD